jgi:hypothetical protein
MNPRKSQINLEAFKKAIEKVPATKPRPIHTMAKIQVAFDIRFICDAEARLNSTVKQYNEDRLKVEKLATKQDRNVLAHILQEHLSHKLPTGVSAIVETNTGYNRRRPRYL